MSPRVKGLISGLVALLPLTLLAGVTEWYSVVQVTDNFKETTFSVMTNEEYTKLTKDLWARNRVLTQAIRMARDEWAKADETKDKVYPVTITCQAEAKRMKTFPDSEQAKAYAAQLGEEFAAKENADKTTTYVEKRIKILQDELENRTKSVSALWIKTRKEELAVMLKERDERRAKDNLIKEMEDKAKGVINTHIEALVAETDKEPSSTITLL